MAPQNTTPYADPRPRPGGTSPVAREAHEPRHIAVILREYVDELAERTRDPEQQAA